MLETNLTKIRDIVDGNNLYLRLLADDAPL